jgi:hypothetical protein
VFTHDVVVAYAEGQPTQCRPASISWCLPL